MFNQITRLNDSPATGAGATHLNDQATARLLRLVKRQRANLDGNLPTYDSLIGYSLFLLLCEYDVRGETPRLKDIHLELGRSPGGVRRLVRALMADGWVEISRSERDLRTRFIVATPKLKRAIASYIQSINAMAADDEMAFTFPFALAEKVVAGLEGTHAGGVRYPVPVYLRYQAEYPKSYQELERLWAEEKKHS